MASKYKGLYRIFYKVSIEVVTNYIKVKILNKNGLSYSIRVLFAPGIIILPI